MKNKLTLSNNHSINARRLHLAAWKISFLLYRVFGQYIYRSKVIAKKNIPETGPVLLLSNHGAVLDPIWVALAARRPVYFMANERLFKKKIIGPWIKLLGAFSKRKFEPDFKSLTQLLAHVRDGKAVGLFPEGRRTWDGRLLSLTRGTGGLVKKLDIPVAFIKIKTSFLYSPQWAKYSRWVPINIEVSDVVHFSASTSASEIEERIVKELSIDPLLVEAPKYSFGIFRACGLPQYVWACPECFEIDALRIFGFFSNIIECSHCHCKWLVTMNLFLSSSTINCNSYHIFQAYDKVNNHFEKILLNAENAANVHPICFRSELSKVYKRTEGNLELLFNGTLTLTATCIVLTDTANRLLWNCQLKTIDASFIQSKKLLIRTGGQLFYLDLSKESLNKWDYFINRLSA